MTIKVLVFSDSHGKFRNIQEVIELNKSVCDLIVFLGDGISDIERVRDKYDIPCIIIKGNCDVFMSGEYTEESMIYIGDTLTFLSHGHKYGVKYSYGKIALEAYERGASLVLFGHTHRPIDEYLQVKDRNIKIFNPGSIKDGNFGVLETSGKVLISNIGKLEK